MKTFSSLTLALAVTLAATVPASAQACRPLTVPKSGVHVDALRLYDMSGKPADWAARTTLPAVLNVTDCGDPNYVMMQVAKTNFLVRKSDLTMPRIIECSCPTSKPSNTPGTPGLNDPVFCPAEQCLKR